MTLILAAKVIALFCLLPMHSFAETTDSTFFDTVMVNVGQGLRQNLLQIPKHLAANDLTWDRSYLIGLQLSKQLGVRDAEGPSLLAHEIEFNLLQHWGQQHNSEVAAAYMLRTPDFHMGAVAVNFAFGLGLSDAIGTPSYEDGPVDDPSRRYQLQFFFPLEFEWHLPDSRMALVTRVHHRSGVGGVIAPKHVGSNFLTAGLRYTF